MSVARPVPERKPRSILGAEKMSAQPEGLADLPAHFVHSFRVDMREARLLNIFLPGGFERVITEFGVPAKSRVIPPLRNGVMLDLP